MIKNRYIEVAKDSGIVVIKFNDRTTMMSVAKILNESLENMQISGVSIAVANPSTPQETLNKAMVATSKQFRGE